MEIKRTFGIPFGLKVVTIAVMLIASTISLSAQRIALTTNLLEDAVLTPNFGIDIAVADRQSISFDLSCSPWKLSPQFYNKSMTFRAGYKYWFNQAFYAHHLCFDGVATSTDCGAGKYAFKYEYVALGVGYGYSFIVGKRLNISPSIGVGLAYGNRYEGYDHMSGGGVGVEATAKTGFSPFVTRLTITIQYILN